jgi:arylformamidase
MQLAVKFRIPVPPLRQLAPALSIVVLAVALAAQANESATADSCPPAARPETVAYERIAGVPANATSLDIYVPPPGCAVAGAGAPVVMWVHGGAYHTGDKANQVANKVKLFNGLGYVFVSVNYRLTVAGDPGSAHYPDHFRDVAAAVAWIKGNIASRDGDPARIALLGHSAGADIVSNVAVNPRWLGERGVGLRSLRCAGPLDTEGFDKVRASDRGEQLQWLDSLGNNPNYKTETSASHLIEAGPPIPSTITVFRGSALRQSIESDFAARLRAAGIAVTLLDARSLSHEEVNRRIGAAGDTVMTPPIVRFLAGCFTVPPQLSKPSLRKHPARIVRIHGRRQRAKVTFAFASRSGAVDFQCRLDTGPFRTCRSPRSFWVAPGRHSFAVRAVSGLGSGPAKMFRFRVAPHGL